MMRSMNNWLWINRLKKLINKGLKPVNTSILLIGPLKKKVEKIRKKSKLLLKTN